MRTNKTKQILTVNKSKCFGYCRVNWRFETHSCKHAYISYLGGQSDIPCFLKPKTEAISTPGQYALPNVTCDVVILLMAVLTISGCFYSVSFPVSNQAELSQAHWAHILCLCLLCSRVACIKQPLSYLRLSMDITSDNDFVNNTIILL